MHLRGIGLLAQQQPGVLLSTTRSLMLPRKLQEPRAGCDGGPILTGDSAFFIGDTTNEAHILFLPRVPESALSSC